MRLLFFCSLLLLSGCYSAGNDIRFCADRAGILVNDADALIVDIPGRRMIGSDVESSIEVAQNADAVGFFGQIPLALPKRHISGINVHSHWVLHQYRFTASIPDSSRPDQILVDAAPVTQDNNLRGTTSSILYSLSKGVISIRWSTFAEGRRIDQELHSCGKKRLDLSSFPHVAREIDSSGR